MSVVLLVSAVNVFYIDKPETHNEERIHNYILSSYSSENIPVVFIDEVYTPKPGPPLINVNMQALLDYDEFGVTSFGNYPEFINWYINKHNTDKVIIGIDRFSGRSVLKNDDDYNSLINDVQKNCHFSSYKSITEDGQFLLFSKN